MGRGLLVIAYVEPGDMIFGVLNAIWSWIVVILPTLSASCVSELFAVANFTSISTGQIFEQPTLWTVKAFFAAWYFRSYYSPLPLLCCW